MGRIHDARPALLYIPGHEKPIEVYHWQVSTQAHRWWGESEIELKGTVYPRLTPDDVTPAA